MINREKEPICTVLLISYNHAEFFEEAIESVLCQETKYSFSIHIFDDASTDGTIELIKKYVQRYPKLITATIAHQNRGAQANIWGAYSSVKTKYCILLEADDYWCDKRKLELQISAMEGHPNCSFCGHNTRYHAMNEECREYEEGSLLNWHPVLKTKNIFSYEDFCPIKEGGYIPYVPARLLRTECILLDEIRYKESFLFDHTQFYYLLLKGDYYYIDRPMSVYRRTGKGTASEKKPLEFLTTFLQNSIDFNKQTNYKIADKIYSDCQLQIDFRLKTNQYYQGQKLSWVDDNKKAYIVSPVAIGDTMILAGYKKEIEKKYKVSLSYIIKPQYESVMKLYGISDYKVVPDMDSLNWDTLADKADKPELGKVFLGHPVFYPEYRKMYECLRNKCLDVDFLTFFRQFLGLPVTAKFEFPKNKPVLSNQAKQILKSKDLSKTVLICPEASSCPQLPRTFWEETITDAKKHGFDVLINTDANLGFKGVTSIFLSIADTIALASNCKCVYSLRSGLCDVMAPFCKDMVVYYPGYADLYIFGISNMYGEQFRNVNEKLIVEYFLQPHVNSAKAFLFGIIPVPNFIYRFYLNHRQRLAFFKRFVIWKSSF